MCVHCVKREHLLDRRGVQKYLLGLADCLGTPHGLFKIGAVSRMVYISCGDERFLVYQLGALCRSTGNI
jgi:hypothetical protein